MQRVKVEGPGVLLAVVLALVSISLAKLPGFKVLGPLTLGLLLGMGVQAIRAPSSTLMPGIRTAARSVLRLGIVLMGSRLDFGLVAKAGPQILLLDLAVIVTGLLLIPRVARWFQVPERLGMLLAVGTSICGASAVVAAGPVTRADEEEVTLAVGLCGILGTIGVLFFVFGGSLLGLSSSQLAILSGSTLHEVAQVMAAAFTWGTAAGDLGTLVKLTRVVMLAPTLIVLSMLSGRGQRLSYTWQDPPIPWFVVGFLVMGVGTSVGLVNADIKGWLTTSSVFLMTTAMAAMGLNLKFALLRKAGMKVIYAGLLGFGLLVALSYTAIRVWSLGL